MSNLNAVFSHVIVICTKWKTFAENQLFIHHHKEAKKKPSSYPHSHIYCHSLCLRDDCLLYKNGKLISKASEAHVQRQRMPLCNTWRGWRRASFLHTELPQQRRTTLTLCLISHPPHPASVSNQIAQLSPPLSLQLFSVCLYFFWLKALVLLSDGDPNQGQFLGLFSSSPEKGLLWM